MPNTSPLVHVATVCELALVEQDNVLSAIRMVDVFYITASAGAPVQLPPVFDVTLLVALKSGDVTGERFIRIVFRRPNGETAEVYRGIRSFRGGEHGTNIVLKTAVETREFGLYWFDVMEADNVLTSIPFRLAPGPPPPRHQPMP